MERHHAHRRRRRERLAALIPLAVAAMAILAASLPTPLRDGPGIVVAGAPRTGAASPAVASTSAPATERPLLPIVEPAEFPVVRERPQIAVAQPKPGVVRRTPAGAKAVFLGDSYTTGWAGAGIGARGWPRLVGQARHWQTVNLAVAGTGFINPGWDDQPVGSLVAAAIRQKPDVVFLATGHNDSRWSAAATARAADAVIDRLHRALPAATLVIVAPIWQNGSPPQRCLDLRDHLRRKAVSVGALFVDPLAGRWFAGSAHRYIGPDGLHPTDAGHRRIADRILAGIAKLE